MPKLDQKLVNQMNISEFGDYLKTRRSEILGYIWASRDTVPQHAGYKTKEEMIFGLLSSYMKDLEKETLAWERANP